MAPAVVHINLARGFRGGERQTELLIRELSERGVEQSLVARRGAALGARLRHVDGLRVDPVGTPWMPRPLLLRGAVMHAHEARAAHLAHVTHRLTGRPYLVTRRAWERPGVGVLTRGVYRKASAVVAISEAVARGLENWDPSLPTRVIHSAAGPVNHDAALVERLRERWRGRFVVGHAGALVDRHKGQGLLIDAARGLAGEIPGLLVVLLGDGPDREALARRARGLDNVVFEGFVEDVASYLAAFDLFAFPSRYEALGSSLLDALTAGLPVIASRVDGIPEIVRHNEEGLLVPPGDAAALAEAIRVLHGNVELRKRFGEGSRQRATRFSAAAMAQRYQELYQELVPGVRG